jgi:hypothetical protein
MKKYEHLMWDIESLDTLPSAVVLSIGAVAFNLEDSDTEASLSKDSRCFYTGLAMQDQMDEGRTVDAATLKWWLKQGTEAQTVFWDGTRSVITGLSQLHRFCVSHKIKYIWGNGNMFDNVAIRSLYNDFDMASSYPVSFRADMDLRTLKLLAPEETHIERVGTVHNALDDAKYQVLKAQSYYRSLRS